MNEEEKKLYEEFQDKFPIDKLDEMTLERYTAISKEGFSFWILDDIFGTTNYNTYKINLGIYKYEKNPKFGNKKNTPHGFDDTYAWQYDTNRDRAFRIIKNRIIETATNAKNYSQNQDKQYLKNIDKINLPPVYKWKIAFLYSDRELINCYSVDKLKELLKNLQPNVKTSIPISDLQYQLIKIKKAKPTEFAKAFATLWSSRNKNNKNDNEDKTMTNTEEPILAQECAKLLKNTKNLILHGAPGTGKTYLAKEKIAPELAGLLGIKKEDVEIGFVQFHPSYDYTDFVEGIRPTTDGKFNLEDGIFKKFCEKAILGNISDSEATDTQKTQNNKNSNQIIDYYRRYSDLLEYSIWFNNTLDIYFSRLKDFDLKHDDNVYIADEELKEFEKELHRFKDKVLKYSPEPSDSSKANNLAIPLKNLSQNFDLFDKKIKKQPKDLSAWMFQLRYRLSELTRNLYDFLIINPKNDFYTCWPLLISDLDHSDDKRIYNYEFKINRVKQKTSGKYFSLTEINSDTKTTFSDLEKVYKGKRKSKTDKICSDIINYLKEKYGLKDYNENETTIESAAKIPEYAEKKNPFIFIIDEINRGELSKIFGELFFSIDPSYRVSLPINAKNKPVTIQTQYANMTTEPNEFDKALGITAPNNPKKGNNKNKGNYGHFFVPENVYIIGTMNDIDRSVESMDLAMRRRFTFKEITAEDSQAMLNDSNGKLKGIADKIIEELKTRMKKLNDEIIKIEFSQDYQIGAAYFLKFADYYNLDKKNETEAFENLWKYNLAPLLKEYLRGQDPDDEKFNKLKKAYENDKNPKEQAGEQQK